MQAASPQVWLHSDLAWTQRFWDSKLDSLPGNFHGCHSEKVRHTCRCKCLKPHAIAKQCLHRIQGRHHPARTKDRHCFLGAHSAPSYKYDCATAAAACSVTCGCVRPSKQMPSHHCYSRQSQDSPCTTVSVWQCIQVNLTVLKTASGTAHANSSPGASNAACLALPRHHQIVGAAMQHHSHCRGRAAAYSGDCISYNRETALLNANCSSMPPSKAAVSALLLTGATPPSASKLVRSLEPADIKHSAAAYAQHLDRICPAS
jgi:hypothetical protein